MRRFVLALGLFAVAAASACYLPGEKPKSAADKIPKCPEPAMYGMVLATIHEYHLADQGFPLARVGDVLDAYRPDVVLVDIPDDILKGDHPEMGPVELEYVKYIAGTRQTDVVSIAPPPRDEPPVNAQPDKLDVDALRNEVGTSLDDLTTESFEQLNGDEGTLKIYKGLNARTRYVKGNPDWAMHEAWLERGADKAIATAKPRKVLAIVDPEYRWALQAYFAGRGMGIKNPVKVVAKSTERREESSVPAIVLHAWQEQADKLRDRESRLQPGDDRSSIEAQLRVIEAAVDKNGGCCVSPDVLHPPQSDTPPPADAQKHKHKKKR